MKEKLYDPMSMIRVLVIISMLMFVSLFINTKTAALGLLIWVLNIGWILHVLTRGRKQSVIKYYEKTLNESKENKQYLKSGIYAVALPLCAVGIIFVFLDILALFMM